MNFIEANSVGLRYELPAAARAPSCSSTRWAAAWRAGTRWRRVSARAGAYCATTRAGAGLSEKVRGALSIDTMVDDLAALMDALGVTGKVALAGIAVGGAIALHAAARLPQRISAAVVGSPAIGIAAERRAAVLARVDAIERNGMRSVVDESMANGYPPELRADAARFAAFRARWLGNDPASYAAIYRMLAGTDLQAELARIACPVLVLGGALDRVRPPALAEPVARAIPGARYALLQTGHYMAVETPELVASAIGDFLDEVGA